MTEIESIPVEYRGIAFRSHIEARWAAFFDALIAPFEYEKEVVDLGWCRYLPDFWIPTQECWVEIKGAYPTILELRKAKDLALKTKRWVFLFYGSVKPQNDNLAFSPSTGLSASGYGWRKKFDGEIRIAKYGERESPELRSAYRAADEVKLNQVPRLGKLYNLDEVAKNDQAGAA